MTGARTVIGKTSASLTGITYDYTTATLYGIGYDGSKYSSLYKVNQIDGSASYIGTSVAGILINVACDTLGNLYSLNISNDTLYKINKTTGKAMPVGNVGFSASYAQGMDFDRTTNNLYLAAYNATNSSGELRYVDVKTGATTLLGAFENGCEITGFAIPYHFKTNIYDAEAVSIDEQTIMPSNTTISPAAEFLNLGETATFNVTMQISYGYTSTKTITNLASFDGQTITFDPWSPENGNYTITVFTQLPGDTNKGNDTLKQSMTVENLTKVYGYLAYDSTAKIPVGPVYTYLEAPLLVNSITGVTDTNNLIESGTWGGNNKWYGTTNITNQLLSIDTVTGKRNIISQLDIGFDDITFDYTTNTLFGVYSDNTYSYLYKISRATGYTMLVGTSVTGTLINLACDNSGNLYAVSISNDTIYSLNKTTGLGTPIGYIGFKAQYIQGMEFDHRTNICYMAAFNVNTSSGELRTVNLTTGNSTLIGAFGGRRNIEIASFAIPYNGKTPSTDVGVTAQTSPVSGCGLSEEKVTVDVENMGTDPVNNIPVHYSVDGGAVVDTILSNTISPESYYKLTFKKHADLSVLGNHTIKAYTTLSTDTIASNDTLTYTVDNIDISNLPFSMGFEPSESLTGWNIFDVNNDGYTWKIVTTGGHNGPGCAEMESNPFKSSDDWLLTKCISFEAGRTYQLSYWKKLRE